SDVPESRVNFRELQQAGYIRQDDLPLVLPPRGERGFGWDPVFRPAGEARTFGELPEAEKDRLGHRGRAWRDLLVELQGAVTQ
ncbi:MAG: non-canonical purine NTP pyrophosphatase, partial [Thermoanaerobaculia bacterium]